MHVLQALDGHLSLGYAYFAPEEDVFYENITVSEWRKQYLQMSYRNHTADYAGYTYDAVWTYAFALDTLLSQNLSHYADLHSTVTTK